MYDSLHCGLKSRKNNSIDSTFGRDERYKGKSEEGGLKRPKKGNKLTMRRDANNGFSA